MSDFNRSQDMARRIALLVRQQGGCAYYVGGYVRDALLLQENKDIDMEVHGISPSALLPFWTPSENGSPLERALASSI